MRRTLIVKPTFDFYRSAVIATMLAGVLALTTLAGKPAMADIDDEAAVRDVLMKSALSFEQDDLIAASNVWANDESLIVFESGHANYGWVDYRDHHLAPEMAEMKSTRYALTDLTGKTAWATFKYTISADVSDKGKARHVEGGGLGTAVLEQRAGRWQIVHWHSSAPRRKPAAGNTQ